MVGRVLVVEDDAAISRLLRYNLQREGFDVTACDDGDGAMAIISEFIPDLVILDWMLPGISGVEICRQLRARKDTKELPVIMLTARGEEEDRVRGLNTGADDYLTKPFSMAELMARVRAVMRRTAPGIAANATECGDISLDRASCRVHRAGREVKLGPTEFRLLDTLISRPGRVFSRDQLLDRVWGQDINVEIRTVDVHIGRLRRALNPRGLPDPIRTVRATGYAFDETYS